MTPLEAEELVLSLLRWALAQDAPVHPPARSTRRLLVRTKAYLESQLAQPIHLADVGRAVGASPAYLTDLFRRVEGVPLHRYLTQLRLARALVELPHTDDLTALALGFRVLEPQSLFRELPPRFPHDADRVPPDVARSGASISHLDARGVACGRARSAHRARRRDVVRRGVVRARRLRLARTGSTPCKTNPLR